MIIYYEDEWKGYVVKAKIEGTSINMLFYKDGKKIEKELAEQLAPQYLSERFAPVVDVLSAVLHR